jgi:hypothetical protein
MRNNCNITIKAIIANINNKARRDDSIKTAAFALKLGNNSSNTGYKTRGRKNNNNSCYSRRINNKDKGRV